MKKWLGSALLSGIIAIGAIPSSADAQGTASGTVLEETTGRTLTSALVRIDSLNLYVVTDQNGKFVLPNIPAGDHTLTVRYLGYTTTKQPLKIANGQTTTLNVNLKAGNTELGMVVISGQRQGQAAALNQQKNSPNVTNVVAADQIGRFPDANLGDALKRIPGISVTVDQGEARFGLIRGTEPRLNSVMINGERIPSAEAEVREVQLDLVPADMVQAIEVNKTLTPDMDADAIGGAVNIITRSAPNGRRLSATIGSGYNLVSSKGMGIASGLFGQRFANGRFGMILSGSYFNHYLGSDNIEGEWTEGENVSQYMESFQIREYQIRRLRQSVSGTFDYRVGQNSLFTLRSIYNYRNDWESRYAKEISMGEPDENGVVADAEIMRETKGGGSNARLEKQRTQSHSLAGQHLLGNRLIANWSVAYSRASEHRPDERYISWTAEEIGVQTDLRNPRKPKFSEINANDVTPDAFGFDRIDVSDGFTKDQDLNGRLDFLVPLNLGGQTGSFKFGARYRGKDKLRHDTFDEATPINGALENLASSSPHDYTNADFLAGKYAVGMFTPAKVLGSLKLRDATQFELEDKPDEYAASNYDADERIIAGYAQMSQTFGRGVSVLFGLRAEATRLQYRGNAFDADAETITPTTGKSNYTNLLPSLNARWDLRDHSVIRFAWTNSIARPNYYDLVPYRVFSVDDSELSLGNPSLKPTKSMNFDLMAERYFATVGLISAGVFYKDISNFIFEYTTRDAVDPVSGETFDEISQPKNGSNASLTGFEIAFQRQLDFLPGVARYLGFYTNYTYTTSSVDGLNIEGRENEDLPLPGTAKHSGNASLSFDMPRFTLRTSANFQGSFIDPGELGDSPFFDRYYDRSVNVDANGSFAVNQKIRIFFEANNLTNQPLRYFQGVRSRVMQEEYYNARFTFGLKYDL